MSALEGGKDMVGMAVLGAGPGGYAAAFLAADLGLETVLIDEGEAPGGVCLNRGCIPSKALLHVAGVIGAAKEAGAHGVEFGSPRVDLAKLREWKSGVVAKLTSGIADMAGMRKVARVRGRGRFVSPRAIRVEEAGGGSREIRFEQAIIATGSLPAVPEALRGGDRVWDSTMALSVPEIPARLLVVGGGYIGLELGTAYAGLGSAVTVVEMTAGLLPGADPDLVRPLASRLSRSFAGILTSAKVAALKEAGKGVAVTIAQEGKEPEVREYDAVLAAVGRRPNTADMGLEKAGVDLTPQGFVRTDRQCRTSAEGIFAVGDAAGQPMLAHKASHEARVAVEVARGRDAAFEPRAIPGVVFTDPEVAWCGLTEAQARAAGRKVEVARFPWAASGRALTLDRTEGMTKLVVDPETERILGVGLVGHGAGELISEGALAIESGVTVTDLAMTIHPHPTLSETLMEAAELFRGLCTHLYRPKRK